MFRTARRISTVVGLAITAAAPSVAQADAEAGLLPIAITKPIDSSFGALGSSSRRPQRRHPSRHRTPTHDPATSHDDTRGETPKVQLISLPATAEVQRRRALVAGLRPEQNSRRIPAVPPERVSGPG